MLAADVVEVDVDAAGCCLPQLVGHGPVVVVEGGVEAELAQPLHLLGRSGATNNARRAGGLGYLADYGPDRTCSPGHEDGVALLESGCEHQAGIGRQAGHPQDAEEGGFRSD